MTVVLEIFGWIGWACLAGGGFFLVVGGIGLYRLPDFYSRTHAGGVSDTLGAGLTLLGLVFHTLSEPAISDPSMIVVKLLLIMVFLFFTSPSSGYALVRAAFTQGHQPRLSGQEFEGRLLDGELVREQDL